MRVFLIILHLSLTINVGDTVEWVNDGGNHDVNADINSQTGSSFNNPVSFQSNTTNVVVQ